MNHKESGINKRPSEAVYPADIISDTALQMCSLITFGAWMKCLLPMWRDKTSSASGTIKQFARKWGCSEEEVEDIINEIETTNVADVIKSNNNVTLVSRRLKRREDAKEKTRLRVEEHRCNNPVTPKKVLPSSSLSFSSSISNKKIEAFDVLWQDWLKYRIEIKKPLTTVAVKRQFNQFEKWGIDKSMKAIENSIGHGWRGIFEPKQESCNEEDAAYNLDDYIQPGEK